MSELYQEQQSDSAPMEAGESLFPVRVSPTEVRYLTREELDKAISQDDIQRGLNLAGAWSDLHLSEEELQYTLDKMRTGSKPTPHLHLE